MYLAEHFGATTISHNANSVIAKILAQCAIDVETGVELSCGWLAAENYPLCKIICSCFTTTFFRWGVTLALVLKRIQTLSINVQDGIADVKLDVPNAKV
uniref:Uncharacterized protein n=1 Tax=Panagrolaimus superbus TaxID=310955 RepID=A0A914YJB0_9BILA